MAGISKEEFVVIVAGGTGTRLWPWSRKSRPKQFLNLFGETFLEQVYHRALKITPAKNIFIVAEENYASFLSQYLPDFPLSNFMGEPEKKGTTAAYGYTAIYLKQLNPDAVIHIIAADDYILDPIRYQKSFALARDLIEKSDSLVIYGVKPSDPNTGYGYVKVDLDSKTSADSVDSYRVTGFHEKPTLEVAKKYLADPSYFWHTFGFSVSVPKLLSLIKVHDPATYDVLLQIEADLKLPARLEQNRLKEHYQKLKESNIENQILEAESTAAHMVVLEETWSDVGTWDHLYNLKEKDSSGNVILGDPNKVYSVGVQNSLVAASRKPLALVGVNNLVIVDTDDVTLVCAKESSQDVKKLVDLLKQKQVNDLL